LTSSQQAVGTEYMTRENSNRLRLAAMAFAVFTALAALWLLLRPPIPQSMSYHDFADQRVLFGIPHFWNVVSNLPFLLVGVAGCSYTLRSRTAFLTDGERWPYFCLFLGVGLTAFGSAYYHLAPDNARLVWDRLPMAVAFMGLFSGILAERLGLRFGLTMLPVLQVVGLGSVLYWHFTDDLRPYYFVQFYPALAIPFLVLVFPARYTGTGYLLLALLFYVLAKIAEYPFDAPLFSALGYTLSGHTLKHLLAGVCTYWFLHMLWRRRPLGCCPSPLGARGARF